MQVTTHLKLAFFQTGEFPGIEKSSMSVYLGMHCTYLHNKQTYSRVQRDSIIGGPETAIILWKPN